MKLLSIVFLTGTRKHRPNKGKVDERAIPGYLPGPPLIIWTSRCGPLKLSHTHTPRIGKI